MGNSHEQIEHNTNEEKTTSNTLFSAAFISFCKGSLLKETMGRSE